MTRPTADQGALFDRAYLPHRPLSSDQKAGAYRRRHRDTALEHAYIESNPLVLQSLIITDRDINDTDIAADLAGLPIPTYRALNHHTNTGHIVYGLKDPVCLTDAARRRPVNLLARVEHGLNEILEGDPGFGGRITKNPLHDAHLTLWGEHLYGLRELASALDHLGALPGAGDPRRNVTSSAVGRNVALFDNTRHWGYKAVRRYFGSTLEEWSQAVLTRAYEVNETVIGNDFSRGPLSFTEVRSIAKSVSRWIWRNFDQDSFRARQRALSQRGNQTRWGNRTVELIEGVLND